MLHIGVEAIRYAFHTRCTNVYHLTQTSTLRWQICKRLMKSKRYHILRFTAIVFGSSGSITKDHPQMKSLWWLHKAMRSHDGRPTPTLDMHRNHFQNSVARRTAHDMRTRRGEMNSHLHHRCPRRHILLYACRPPKQRTIHRLPRHEHAPRN